MRRWILLFLALLGLWGPAAVAAEVSSASPASCTAEATAGSTAALRIPEPVSIQLTYVRPDRLKTSHGQPLQEAVAAAIGVRRGTLSPPVQICRPADLCAAGNSDVAPGSARLVLRLEPLKQSVTRLHLEWQQAAAGSTPETLDLLISGSGTPFVKTAMQYIRPKLNGLLDRLEVPLAASAPLVCPPPPPPPPPSPIKTPPPPPLLANGHALRARKALPLVSGALLLGSVMLLNWRVALNGQPAEGDCGDPAGRVILDNCEYRTWRSITGTAAAAGVSAVGVILGFALWPSEPSAAAAEGKK